MVRSRSRAARNPNMDLGKLVVVEGKLRLRAVMFVTRILIGPDRVFQRSFAEINPWSWLLL